MPIEKLQFSLFSTDAIVFNSSISHLMLRIAYFNVSSDLLRIDTAAAVFYRTSIASAAAVAAAGVAHWRCAYLPTKQRFASAMRLSVTTGPENRFPETRVDLTLICPSESQESPGESRKY